MGCHETTKSRKTEPASPQRISPPTRTDQSTQFAQESLASLSRSSKSRRSRLPKDSRPLERRSRTSCSTREAASSTPDSSTAWIAKSADSGVGEARKDSMTSEYRPWPNAAITVFGADSVGFGAVAGGRLGFRGSLARAACPRAWGPGRCGPIRRRLRGCRTGIGAIGEAFADRRHARPDCLAGRAAVGFVCHDLFPPRISHKRPIVAVGGASTMIWLKDRRLLLRLSCRSLSRYGDVRGTRRFGGHVAVGDVPAQAILL